MTCRTAYQRGLDLADRLRSGIDGALRDRDDGWLPDADATREAEEIRP